MKGLSATGTENGMYTISRNTNTVKRWTLPPIKAQTSKGPPMVPMPKIKIS